MTASWKQFAAQAPDLAAFAERRIQAHGLSLLATLRAVGSPRMVQLHPRGGGGPNRMRPSPQLIDSRSAWRIPPVRL